MEVSRIKYNDALEISKDIWWVGHYLPDDPFQCHVYLIKNGKATICKECLYAAYKKSNLPLVKYFINECELNIYCLANVKNTSPSTIVKVVEVTV